MKQDERGLALSTDSDAAVASFDRAVEHFLKFHADTMVLANRALEADPGFAMGHCLKAYLLLLAANPANRPQIDTTLARAQAGAANLIPRERMHLAAATAWHQGTIERSFQIWGQILDADPTDLLAFRISDTIWFRHGQTASILAQADRVTPRWSADLPGYDCARTIWAFAHEEVGDTKGAEPVVDAALERDPTNYFAHHVKAHVLDTDCRAREGDAWLAGQVIHWSLGNNLIHHLWWHRTLMQLDLGERDAVLASYDQDIRNFADPMTKAMPDHYVDLQNANALLWRLEALGLDVGNRWDELADKAEARIGEAGHLLMVPHLMMALAATGRDAAAARFLAALHELAGDQNSMDGSGDCRCGDPGLPSRPRPSSRSARARRRSARTTAAPHPPAWRQQRPARRVLPDADRLSDEGRPSRCCLGNDRPRNRHAVRAADTTGRICRRCSLAHVIRATVTNSGDRTAKREWVPQPHLGVRSACSGGISDFDQTNLIAKFVSQRENIRHRGDPVLRSIEHEHRSSAGCKAVINRPLAPSLHKRRRVRPPAGTARARIIARGYKASLQHDPVHFIAEIVPANVPVIASPNRP